MYQEKRPTCVTVIGWAWIVIGGLMFFSALMGLFASVAIDQMSQANQAMNQEMPTFFRLFPLLCFLQLIVASLGFYSGISFLKLKAWSRKVLEVLTWLFLLFLLVYGAFWLTSWLSMTSGHDSKSFGVMGAVMGTAIIALYGVPLVIMMKYLRSEKIITSMGN